VKLIHPWVEAAIHLFYPSLCRGCQAEETDYHNLICSTCLQSLPYTRFEHIQSNPVQQLFWGRSRIAFASSLLYYVADSPLQNIIHQIKYQDDKKLALFMGTLMGQQMHVMLHEMQDAAHGSLFKVPLNKVKGDKDGEAHAATYSKEILTVPMPMHPRKKQQRGYNQATLLCQGIEKESGISYAENLVVKTKETSTQTTKSRSARWQNMDGVFSVPHPGLIKSKKLIVVDDVITTGASAEAVSNTLLEHGAASVSVYSLAFTL
jgi:predicted amidophosphoribosyltransferase